MTALARSHDHRSAGARPRLRGQQEEGTTRQQHARKQQEAAAKRRHERMKRTQAATIFAFCPRDAIFSRQKHPFIAKNTNFAPIFWPDANILWHAPPKRNTKQQQ